MPGTILSQSILRPGTADAKWLMLFAVTGVMFTIACASTSPAPTPLDQKQRPASTDSVREASKTLTTEMQDTPQKPTPTPTPPTIPEQKDSGEMFLPKGTNASHRFVGVGEYSAEEIAVLIEGYDLDDKHDAGDIVVGILGTMEVVGDAAFRNLLPDRIVARYDVVEDPGVVHEMAAPFNLVSRPLIKIVVSEPDNALSPPFGIKRSSKGVLFEVAIHQGYSYEEEKIQKYRVSVVPRENNSWIIIDFEPVK